MKKRIILLCFCFFFVLIAFKQVVISEEKTVEFSLMTKDSSYVAGESMELRFNIDKKVENLELFLIHSYSKTVLYPEIKNDKAVFKIPELFSKKTGIVSWYLIHQSNEKLKGEFRILPNDRTPTRIENYLGPRTILTGNDHFTMLVVVPTDNYDNPKSDNSKVEIKYQFLNSITTIAKQTKDFIVWKNIYAPTKSGKLLVSSRCDSTTTKEIETEIYPSIATDFKIDYSRNHEFADGNQITTLFTSVITDKYNNIVSDGTFVSFHITTSENMVLKSYGTTINGIAKGQILHPDHVETYKIKGYVTGMAESSSISIDYKPIIKSFDYKLINDNRTIIVGPIKSFMQQLVPDGIKVVVNVYHKDKLIKTLQEDTSKGIAAFTISSEFYKENSYQFEITTLGITQKTQIIKYELNK
ncbi:hypothetical protein [Flavobacterium sp.]|uniref:hypothetical protein n=2 Tax=Flavobacterium sp. TaxID=239 RepID=UPI004048BB18